MSAAQRTEQTRAGQGKAERKGDLRSARVETAIRDLFEQPRSRVWPRGLLYNHNVTRTFLAQLQHCAPATGRFLDLGCGPSARHRPYVEAHSLEWYGCDVMDLQIPHPNFRRTEGALPFGDAYFDVVGAYNVIEHFDHPEFMISEIARVIRDGGLFCGGCAFQEAEHHSYFHLTHLGLEAILKRHGFELTECYPSTYSGAVLQAQRFFGGNGRLDPAFHWRHPAAILLANLNWLPFTIVNALALLRRLALGTALSPFQDCATLFFYATKYASSGQATMTGPIARAV